MPTTRQASMIDRFYMGEALKEARAALDHDEVPVGAVIARRRQLIARAHHQTHTLRDPTAHAAMIAITQAAAAVGERCLKPATIYLTAKPCRMCEGALGLAGIERIVYGVGNSVIENARPETARAMERECTALLTAYRHRRRLRQQLN